MNNTTMGTGGIVDLGTVITDKSDKQDIIDLNHKLAASLVSGLATVATSGSYSDLTGTPTLGAAAAKDVATTVAENDTDLVTSGAVYTAINNLPSPMVFKGTVASSGATKD